MDNSTITLTFGDVGENHKGMQMIGNMVDKGNGYNYDDLLKIKSKFEKKGCNVEMHSLNDAIDVDVEEAHVLVIRNVIQTLYNYDDLCEEQLNLNYDKKAFMYGRVVNKHARYNLCFDDDAQEPDYEEGKGRIVAYDEMPVLNSMRKDFLKYFIRDKFKDMKCESNYYYDITKTGIGYHGDSERRKVVAMRLGASLPIHYQWYKNNKPVGEHIEIMLNGGDMYVMSEKAVGTDWKESSKYTLRHATGCDKYTEIKI